MFAATKKRLLIRSGMSDRDFAKVKFVFVTHGQNQSRELEDGTILLIFR